MTKPTGKLAFAYQSIARLEAERAALSAKLKGANDRARILFDAKNLWAERARKAEAELAAIKGREPVAIANKGNGVFWVKWTDAGKSLRGPGIKLYTLPDAQEGGEV